MKVKYLICLILIDSVVMSCSSDDQDTDSIPCIDVRKTYPEKEIILTDISDVTYVHLNSENEDYLFKGKIDYVTENTIVVGDYASGSILFFSKDGNPKSHFNRYGAGPQEYSASMNTIIYDETSDEVFVIPTNINHIIQVYSSKGEYKRTLTLPQGSKLGQIVSFDDQTLFVYDFQKAFITGLKRIGLKETNLSTQSIGSCFFLISKIDGKVLDYVEVPSQEIDLSVANKSGQIMFPVYRRIVRCEEGAYICNPETDTVFFYGKDKLFTPVLCKKPLVSKLDPMEILNNCIDAGRHQFMVVETLYSEIDKGFILPKKYYMRDKQTGEFFRQKIILPDYKEKEFFISPDNAYFNGKETQAHFSLNLFELKEAYKDNRLGGKLKELVATLNELEDNDVIVFVTFK